MVTGETISEEHIRQLQDELASGQLRWNAEVWQMTHVALGYGVASTPTDAGRKAYRECRDICARLWNSREAAKEKP